MNRSAKVFASVLLMGLSVSACGGDGSPSSQGGEATTAATTSAASGARFADLTGDAAKGEAVFAQCGSCHATQPGVNRAGPTLHAIVGREAGKAPGYNYSPANANAGITWSAEELFQFLESPQQVIPGNKMAFAGIKDPQKRADLIAWLATQK